MSTLKNEIILIKVTIMTKCQNKKSVFKPILNDVCLNCSKPGNSRNL